MTNRKPASYVAGQAQSMIESIKQKLWKNYKEEQLHCRSRTS